MELKEIDEVRLKIRKHVWRLLEESKVALPPFPVHGRIPNFRGAREAAALLASTDEWRRARALKVNPDSPQRHVRLNALREGKILVMPSPRLRRGFLILDPSEIPERLYRKAATIRGAFSLGRLVPSLSEIEAMLPRIDLIVEGSVAVDRRCNRLGKGEGYGDIEYALLHLLSKVDESTPVATSVHDLQLVDEIPAKSHDLPLDIVATPTRIIRCSSTRPRPRGIILESLTREKLEEIPLLREAFKRFYRGGEAL